MNAILEAAGEVQRFCDEQGWRSCIIGGIAVQRWGEPRLTLGVDLTVLTGFGSEAAFVDALLGRFEARRPDAREFALHHRVVLARTSAGIPIDASLGALPSEERAIERGSWYAFGADVEIRTCSAEDLVVQKAFAGRDQDWLGIRGIVLRRGASLDVDLILDEAVPLLELKRRCRTRDGCARSWACLPDGSGHPVTSTGSGEPAAWSTTRARGAPLTP